MGWAGTAMRSGRDQEGAEFYSRNGRLVGPADAELLLDGLEHRADLLHRLLDLFRRRLEGAGPEVERLRLDFDEGGIGRVVWGHANRTALVAGGSSAVARRPKRRPDH